MFLNGIRTDEQEMNPPFGNYRRKAVWHPGRCRLSKW